MGQVLGPPRDPEAVEEAAGPLLRHRTHLHTTLNLEELQFETGENVYVSLVLHHSCSHLWSERRCAMVYFFESF